MDKFEDRFESAKTKAHIDASDGPSLYDRLVGIYGIAGAVDVLADRLYANAAANENPATNHFHQQQGQPGFKFLVTAWSVEETGGPKIYPGRDMRDSHAHLRVSEREFDVVKTEIAATLSHVGVPEREHDQFMDIIESYRSMVVTPGATVTDHDHSAIPAMSAVPALNTVPT